MGNESVELENKPACVSCGINFTRKRYWQQFCSSPCRYGFRRAEIAKAVDLYRKSIKVEV